MPRAPRINNKGTFFHALNRANSKLEIFRQEIDYKDFTELLIKSLKKYKIDIYAYIIMPTHWHIVCSPKVNGELSRWMAWLQMMHTRKWHIRHKTVGRGHFYQGRFKSFIVQDDQHFIQVCRYVERNALRAGLVQRAEDWPWSSLSETNRVPIAKWPVDRPKNYLEFVNEPMTAGELDSIRKSIVKGAPFGDKNWKEKKIKENKLETTVRKVGRPRKSL